MLVGVTGATGFIGTYICRALAAANHGIRVLARDTSDTSIVRRLGAKIHTGDISDHRSLEGFVAGCGCVVHAAADFDAAYGNQEENFGTNLLGSLRLLDQCRRSGTQFIFISTGAVHDKILDDRPVDETHPLWPATTYGAYKAAVEAFLPAYKEQFGTNGSAYRPTSVYGLHPFYPDDSHWYGLVRAILAGKRIETARGGKVVHVEDVAEVIRRAVGRDDVAGESYELTDCHIFDQKVAEFARELGDSSAEIADIAPKEPMHRIISDKARRTFGVGLNRGHDGVKEYVRQLVQVIREREKVGLSA